MSQRRSTRLAARYAADRAALEDSPDRLRKTPRAARRGRIFGSQPGAYGAGLQTLIDERVWDDEADLANAWLTWGQYAYAAGGEGRAERTRLETGAVRHGRREVLHNQDNREHDILDSDDYYQFEGRAGARRAASVGACAGGVPQRPFGP